MACSVSDGIQTHASRPHEIRNTAPKPLGHTIRRKEEVSPLTPEHVTDNNNIETHFGSRIADDSIPFFKVAKVEMCVSSISIELKTFRLGPNV